MISAPPDLLQRWLEKVWGPLRGAESQVETIRVPVQDLKELVHRAVHDQVDLQAAWDRIEDLTIEISWLRMKIDNPQSTEPEPPAVEPMSAVAQVKKKHLQRIGSMIVTETECGRRLPAAAYRAVKHKIDEVDCQTCRARYEQRTGVMLDRK